MEGMGTAYYEINVIGRTYFPKLVSAKTYGSFVKDWTSRGGNVAPVPAPRYPTDRVTYVSNSALEYETPPEKDGIAQLADGAASSFAQYGIITIQGKYLPEGNEDGRVISFLNVALPPDLAYLTPFILAASEPCMLDEDAPSCTMQNGITYPDQ